MTRTRCINIDWLEVHCIEPEQPRDADFFRSLGWDVVERDYGTRVYRQMFTLRFPDGEPFLEIRRAPASDSSSKAAQFFEVGSCHLRLHNRTCYIHGCAKLLADFIEQYGFTFRRISRIDLALDFEKFDSGDDPQKFLDRYLRGKYSKVNQCTIAAHGKDMWDGRFWNSVGWGSKKSPIYTRFYNKTMELREAKDKPYIRQAWASAGLVDDFIHLTKLGADGAFYKPDIWRLEFAIQSSVKNWVTYDIDQQGNPTHLSKRNDLSCYADDAGIITVFSSLVAHYFHFKKFQEGQRKDRCPDKTLFFFDAGDTFYKVEKVATYRPESRAITTLERHLRLYYQTHYEKSLHEAAGVLLEALHNERMRKSAVQPYDESETALLQRLIAYRVNTHSENPVTIDRAHIEALMAIERELFQNAPDETPW